MEIKKKTSYVEDKIMKQVSLSRNSRKMIILVHQDLGQAGCLRSGEGGLREPGECILGFHPALA